MIIPVNGIFCSVRKIHFLRSGCCWPVSSKEGSKAILCWFHFGSVHFKHFPAIFSNVFPAIFWNDRHQRDHGHLPLRSIHQIFSLLLGLFQSSPLFWHPASTLRATKAASFVFRSFFKEKKRKKAKRLIPILRLFFFSCSTFFHPIVSKLSVLLNSFRARARWPGGVVCTSLP